MLHQSKNIALLCAFKYLLISATSHLFLSAFSIPDAHSQTALSPVAVFERCYAHLTRQKVARNDARRMRVVNGQISASAACMEVFNSASLNPSTGLIDLSKPESTAVLQTFNDFHRSWFPSDNMETARAPLGQGCGVNQEKVQDVGEPALHFTRALLASGIPFTEVLTGTSTLEAVRSNGAAAGGSEFVQFGGKDANGNPIYTPISPILIQTGRLQGIRPISSQEVSKTINVDKTGMNYSGSVAYKASFGGGFLGTQPFLALNFGPKERSERMNGGAKVPRRWAKVAMETLTCRSFPLLRKTDAQNWTKSTSDLPFRRTSACMSCHATMDSMAGVVRNLAFRSAGANECKSITPLGPLHTAAFLPAENYLDSGNPPPDNDPDYYKRPPNGRIFYRGYNGVLHDTKVDNLSDLASELIKQDDIYVCAAKRYFEYFTGISVDLRDLGDPDSANMSQADLHYRNKVIQLGQQLRSTNSLRSLIQSIISMPLYSRPSLREPLGAK